MTFKAKPAFSVKKLSEDFSRPVLVFGVNSFTGNKTSNYEGCHYVHYSNVGNNHHFSGLWDMANKGVAEIHSTANILGSEPRLKDAFYTALFSNNSGVFELAFKHDSSTMVLLNRIFGMGDNIIAPMGHLQLFVKGTFMGCVDCNSKMTISEYIEPLFELLFGETTYDPVPKKAKKKKDDAAGSSDQMHDSDATTLPTGSQPRKRTPQTDGFDTEIMLHYIMLCGLVETGDREFSPPNPDSRERYFKLTNIPRRRLWLLKCIMMWCSLQIMFCSWKMAALYDGLRHHTNYIYRGVMDFYLSMWLFALYSVCTYDKPSALQFDEFHYYYASMMPCFYNKRRGYTGHLNLCSLILTEANIGQEKFPSGDVDKLNEVQQTIEILFNRVTAFWNSDMENICLSIHRLRQASPLDGFFIPFDKVESNRRRVVDDTFELGIETFCTQLTSYWYWFHFRYITMGVISQTSRDYLRKPGMPLAAKNLWLGWCRTFDNTIQTLNVRMYLEQKAERIRLRALGYDNRRTVDKVRMYLEQVAERICVD